MIMKNINIEQIKSKASILPYMVWGDFVSCWFFVISPDKKNQKESTQKLDGSIFYCIILGMKTNLSDAELRDEKRESCLVLWQLNWFDFEGGCTNGPPVGTATINRS